MRSTKRIHPRRRYVSVGSCGARPRRRKPKAPRPPPRPKRRAAPQSPRPSPGATNASSTCALRGRKRQQNVRRRDLPQSARRRRPPQKARRQRLPQKARRLPRENAQRQPPSQVARRLLSQVAARRQGRIDGARAATSRPGPAPGRRSPPMIRGRRAMQTAKESSGRSGRPPPRKLRSPVRLDHEVLERARERPRRSRGTIGRSAPTPDRHLLQRSPARLPQRRSALLRRSPRRHRRRRWSPRSSRPCRGRSPQKRPRSRSPQKRRRPPGSWPGPRSSAGKRLPIASKRAAPRATLQLRWTATRPRQADARSRSPSPPRPLSPASGSVFWASSADRSRTRSEKTKRHPGHQRRSPPIGGPPIGAPPIGGPPIGAPPIGAPAPAAAAEIARTPCHSTKSIAP